MAIYHFSAKIISRAAGSSALASAAYRSASRLHDQRLDRHHDFSNKAGVVHSEVMLPEGAPEHLSDRERLWNDVEAVELRKDAQLAREIEFAIPREMTKEQGIELARDFVRDEFVERGMIADLNVHWDIGADGLAKPHAHVMLTMRDVGEDGFGKKNRDWNRTDLLEKWRERWSEHVNQRLAELDIDARIDHRSLEAQGIDLEPQHKIGPAASRMAAQGLESERVDDHREIARSNGDKIIANPGMALDAITRTQATFTTRDLAMFAHRHSEGKYQFDQVMASLRGAPELVVLGKDGRGEDRFTSQDMIETEQRLARATQALAEREHHRVAERDRERAIANAERRGLALSPEQRSAFEHVTDAKDLGVVIGYAGTGKSAMLGVAREAWEGEGLAVRGVALSGIAADNLESGSGIASRTIASMERQWEQGRELLTNRDVLVIDEAGMIGTRQMERVLGEAEKRGAKVVLVGDPEQLQAIEAGAAFRSIAERRGSVEITEIRRQREDWQRHATRQLASGRTAEAIRAYDEAGHVHMAETREGARANLIDRWDRDRALAPGGSRIILTHTNDEVRELNLAARERLRAAGDLGGDVSISTERGERRFATGDRIMFLLNERSLGVKNGTLGQVQSLTQARIAVMLDDGRAIAFDVKDYTTIDHGYAATVHKAQGVTVDRVHVLATPGLDRHAAYVALSRHRDRVDLHYGHDDFADQSRLVRTLSRDRSRDMASDYAQEPERRFAERRGITFRERVADLVRKVPDKVRGMFDGLRLPVERPVEPAKSPEEQARQARRNIVQRHARAVVRIFESFNKGLQADAGQVREINEARKGLNALREYASRDLETAYKKDPPLARETAGGSFNRAMRALQLEAEIRLDPGRRADQFVERWARLSGGANRAYVAGDYTGRKSALNEMAGMAKGLERDPQLESLLAARKAELGISVDTGRRLGAELAFNHGIDFGRGRGLGR
ncbi:Ti-type conjugative transfer relaxase TraA [Sphingomonas spermidinifaciens]|uniref:Ti-type conjugative transfer relaxase TraA n=1 Tax=Sphingomonas spermidinifaciens TaxID=1141889 RepID=A0A2A4B1W7_9SPHN|nr:Ti-type conjugative transfer relaxase TraA [Sphingomonas spermidinifaciens]PCD02441.1 Ti-type conjugative transfer relaxase TraA [Sphingomonas spermidinifaciens]